MGFPGRSQSLLEPVASKTLEGQAKACKRGTKDTDSESLTLVMKQHMPELQGDYTTSEMRTIH